MDKFTLVPPKRPVKADKQPIIRLKPLYYKTVCLLKAQTGLPLGNIVEQCIYYALSHME